MQIYKIIMLIDPSKEKKLEKTKKVLYIKLNNGNITLQTLVISD